MPNVVIGRKTGALKDEVEVDIPRSTLYHLRGGLTIVLREHGADRAAS